MLKKTSKCQQAITQSTLDARFFAAMIGRSSNVSALFCDLESETMSLLARTRPRRQRPAPATPVAPLASSAVQRGLRLSIVEGALSNIHVSVTTGAFLTGFALLLGVSDFELGVIGALPFIGQLFQFVGAYLEERLGERRRLVVLTAGVSRTLWALFAALPFLGGLGDARLPIFLLVLMVSQALIGIAGNAWTSWMSDLVPPRQRGRYFGARNTVTSVTAMASTWLAGRTLDYYDGANNAALGYALIFGMAVVSAIAGVIVLSRQPEPRMPQRPRVRPVELFSAPLRHPRFRALILTATGWSIATGIASPFFNAYGIQNLKLSFATLALFGVATSAVALVTQPYIGRLQDRYGDRRVLIISVGGVVLLPWGWILSTPTFLLPLWMTSIFSGVFWPGITQGLLNLVMDRAPVEGRGAYVAAYGAVTGIGTFAASLLGGVIAGGLGGAVVSIGSLTLNHYAFLFALSSLGRATMALVFARRL
jgi:MFS family permease